MHAAIIDVGRGPQIAGTRITIYDIMDYLRLDWGHASIALWLRLSSAQVLAAMDYIEKHRAEVDATYKEILEREARGNPPEVEAKRVASRAKLQALLAEKRRNGSREVGHASDPRGQE